MRTRGPDRLVIGLAEYVSIPEWGIAGLRAKIDTGARSSALHVENLREGEAGLVYFDVRLHREKREKRVSVVAPVARRTRVRSSTGHSTRRIFVSVAVQIGPVVRRIDMGLVDRARMIYRMLLGRTALGGEFLVDPSARYLLTSAAHHVRDRDAPVWTAPRRGTR